MNTGIGAEGHSRAHDFIVHDDAAVKDENAVQRIIVHITMSDEAVNAARSDAGACVVYHRAPRNGAVGSHLHGIRHGVAVDEAIFHDAMIAGDHRPGTVVVDDDAMADDPIIVYGNAAGAVAENLEILEPPHPNQEYSGTPIADRAIDYR